MRLGTEWELQMSRQVIDPITFFLGRRCRYGQTNPPHLLIRSSDIRSDFPKLGNTPVSSEQHSIGQNRSKGVARNTYLFVRYIGDSFRTAGLLAGHVDAGKPSILHARGRIRYHSLVVPCNISPRRNTSSCHDHA